MVELRRAFSLSGPHGELTEQDRLLLQRVAAAIHRRAMAMPAVLFLESMRPLGYLGSQVMAFLRPFLTLHFSPADYERLAAIIERREGVAALIEQIQAYVDGACAGGRR